VNDSFEPSLALHVNDLPNRNIPEFDSHQRHSVILSVVQIIHVECKAWFEGVVHSSRDKEGLTQFEIFIEN
jgi:hypothetical protein